MLNPSLQSQISSTPYASDSGSEKDLHSGAISAVLLTGGFDRPYVFGLALALDSRGIFLDVVGGPEIDSPEFHQRSRLNFLNLYWDTRVRAGLFTKIRRVAAFYGKLIRYMLVSKPRIVHILWNNKVQLFDRTLLMVYYKLLGKQIVLTAHNINAGRRDGNDSFLNRISLKIQYRLANHIFVHTQRMKCELRNDFGVAERNVSVIPFGINNSVPDSGMSEEEARTRLGVGNKEKVLLFFGNIGPYKGLDFLVGAFQELARKEDSYRLIIAGKLRGGSDHYFDTIKSSIDRDITADRILQHIRFIPDEDTEIYFKAADVLVLPYREVFQSGVLFLSYSFGLPVVASDVGSMRDEILVGKTGFVCRACDSKDLADTIATYFASDLFRNLKSNREILRKHANERNSWAEVSESTSSVYRELLKETR